MPPEQSSKIRNEFIKLFVEGLINNALTETERERLRKQSLEHARQIQETNETISFEDENEKMVPSMMHIGRTKSFPIMPVILPRYSQPRLQPGQQPEKINLGKLAKLLLDPSVLSIECPGPEKNVLINRSGKIHTSPVRLSDSEIKNILNETSEKTRIPLETGLFKAAFQDLIITAVMSEFAGTRFIIQKRNPFQQY